MPFSKTAKLKTGEEVYMPVLITTNMHLQELMNTDPTAFIELITFARDPKHTMLGNTQELAQRFSLLKDNGTMDRTVSAIILSSVEGNDLDMTLVNPLESSSASEGSPKPTP